MEPIYLDYNSTTPIDPAVVDAINECYAQGYANPASQHRLGQQARRKLEELRTDIIRLLGGQNSGMDADRLVFTSGGTESNNLALFGLTHFFQSSNASTGGVAISPIEHPSILQAANLLKTNGNLVEFFQVDSDGLIDLNQLTEQIKQSSYQLVSSMLVNNETGVIQPITEIVKACSGSQILVHTDAVQAVGKIPVNFRELGVDALTFTPHKFHGPRGIGGLLLKSGIEPTPTIYGGFQQMGFRPGTEDVAMVAGLHRALELAVNELSIRSKQMLELRNHLENRICSECPFAVVVGLQSDRAPHTSNISFLGVDRQALLMAADMQGLAISTGSACASGSSEPSHVLTAMNLDSDTIMGSIRISVGHDTTIDEINLAVDRILLIANNLRQ